MATIVLKREWGEREIIPKREGTLNLRANGWQANL
jgi:hypothetical protein